MCGGARRNLTGGRLLDGMGPGYSGPPLESETAMIRLLVLTLLVALAAAPAGAQLQPKATAGAAKADDGDRHSGYYYPPPESSETYVARALTMPNAGRGMRIGFTAGLIQQMDQRPYRVGYVMFVKGAEA
jgi:Zn-dependent protease with chaperone function